MIEAIAVSKFFGRHKVLDDVDLTVEDGKRTYLLGLNGAGKTTLLNLICGLSNPTSGHVLVNGHRYSSCLNVLQELGVHLDYRSFNPRQTAQRHLKWVARGGAINGRRIDEILDLVGLNQYRRRKVGDFSLGMMQRLGIATALLGDPQTIILDEPMNGLDMPSIIWLRRILSQLADEGRCIFVTSHFLDEVERNADRVVILNKGKIVVDSSLEELKGRAGNEGKDLESIYLAIVGEKQDPWAYGIQGAK